MTGKAGTVIGNEDWEPEEYQQFSHERSRSAQDLMDRIPLRSYRRIADLGCGTGDQTTELKRRWPEARVTGVDASPAMLARVPSNGVPSNGAPSNGVQWLCTDIAAYAPPEPLDLIYSNAALHWLDDHAALLPKLVSLLTPGGILAVQMPRNHDAPSHKVIREVASRDGWSVRPEQVQSAAPVNDPPWYYDILAACGVTSLDIWETTCLHVLEGDDPVARWIKSTALRPWLNGLKDDAERQAFFVACSEALRVHYPKRSDGRTLFPFRRLFMVCER